MDSAAQTLILVVEDDPAIAALMSEVLEEEGYRCVTASSAPVAFGLIDSAEPALITLDLGLPGVSGAAMLYRLRANPRTRDLPVIIVSAERVIEAQLRASSQAVVIKPFDLDLLVATVRRVLGLAHPAERGHERGAGASWHPQPHQAAGQPGHYPAAGASAGATD